MTGDPPQARPNDLPLCVRAEAAAWLASLGGPHRTSELEARFSRWLTESEPHRIAWERVSDAWDLAGGLASRIVPPEDVPGEDALREEFPAAELARRPPDRARRARPWSRRRALVLTGAAGVVGAVGAFGLLASRRGTVSTGRGERRVVSLKDGTRITLNTDTRLVVRYRAAARRVWLERGEALFEVAKAPHWPFIVTAAGHDIRALGTAFEVRRYAARQVSIILVEGRIRVSPAWEGVQPSLERVTVLASPGQRLSFAPDRPPRLDRARLKQVIAWQSGEVVFDRTLLSVAAGEMNRYSRLRIVIADPVAARLRLSGLFQAGDSAQFAEAVAETFRLRRTRAGDRIILASESAPTSARPSR
ncbi:MAG: FecR family protein [Steroidobacteraceae bacterium]